MLGRAQRGEGRRTESLRTAAAPGGRAGTGSMARYRAGKKANSGNVAGRMARSGSRAVLGRGREEAASRGHDFARCEVDENGRAAARGRAATAAGAGMEASAVVAVL